MDIGKKMLRKKIQDTSLIIFLLVIICSLSAAWLENIPATLEQPDGTYVDVFYSGDEFHNWIHDTDNYTIVRDSETDFLCWAQLSDDGFLVSTGLPIHLNTPQSLRLEPNINISEERYIEKRINREEPARLRNSNTPSTGAINNIVIFIRFADESEFSPTVSFYDGLFNRTEGALSLKSYFWQASYQQLIVNSHLYPTPSGNNIVSYQCIHPRNYYRPHSTSNPIGYTSNDDSRIRSHTLLADAINFVAPQIPESMILDSNNNGFVDSICFVISGNAQSSTDLLWPHKWSLFSQHVSIHGKRVYDYNVNLQNMMNVAVLAHEFAHTLGAPDLYRYYGNQSYVPIGQWCLMASTNTSNPQSIVAFVKSKYFDWIFIPTIFIDGTYTLNPLTTHQTDNALRIVSPNDPTQHFLVEYRRHGTGQIDNSLSNSGVLIYRVNTLTDGGNMQAPDELYVFRPNGTATVNGQLNSAQFSVGHGRTAFNDTTNPSSFLLNGGAGGINISNIGIAGETIDLTITVPNGDIDPFPAELIGRIVDGKPTLFWSQTSGATGYKIFRNFFTHATIGPVTTFRDVTAVPGITYTYQVSAFHGTMESDTSNIITLSVPEIVADDERVIAKHETFLLQNFPNPFNPTTLIEFSVGSSPARSGDSQTSTSVQISVYNIRGQHIKNLVEGVYTTGQHSVVWDGTDDKGNSVRSGVYLYRLVYGDLVETRKMVLIK
jgi:M6 family metalloprotease-like protein